MPRKEKMVSRTVEMTDVTVMCVELDTAEIFNEKVKLEGHWTGSPPREILNAVEDVLTSPETRVKPVEVLDMEEVTFKFVMPLSRFIAYATDSFKVDVAGNTKEEI